MPEYFDSTSSKPKKTKKTRYAGGESVETYNAQVQRKYHGGSIHGYPGGIAGMKKHIAEIEGMSDPAWTVTPAGKIVRGLAKGKRDYMSKKFPKKLKGKAKRGTGGGDE